ncbi:MAG: prohibitin family protein [Candidatus Gracilibacteria bacterium]|nr:prohibitin family protein [Candidatus Gracilibacteria bacterium]MDD2908572.1 prohibitin family protein [Candidatus Gracilibacteria bacterium]
MATYNSGASFINEIKAKIKSFFKWVVFVILFFMILGVFFGSFGTIKAGEKGILLRFGAVTGQTYNDGLYFKIPYIDDMIIMNVRVLKEQVDANSASKDLQTVNTVVALNFHLNAEKVGVIYKEVGLDYKEKLIDPAIQESIKASTAKFTAEELITKREEVKDMMKELLKKKLTPRFIVVDDVNIVNFNFSESFNRAIEEKVTAEQEALAAKNKLERIKFEAEQAVAASKGKAEASRIEAEALKSNPEILELRALEKWNGVLPQVTGSNTPFVNIK